MPIKELMGKGGEDWFFSDYLNSFGYLDNMAISLIVKGTLNYMGVSKAQLHGYVKVQLYGYVKIWLHRCVKVQLHK